MSTAGMLLVKFLGPVLICSLWHLQQEVSEITTVMGKIKLLLGLKMDCRNFAPCLVKTNTAGKTNTS